MTNPIKRTKSEIQAKLEELNEQDALNQRSASLGILPLELVKMSDAFTRGARQALESMLEMAPE